MRAALFLLPATDYPARAVVSESNEAKERTLPPFGILAVCGFTAAAGAAVAVMLVAAIPTASVPVCDPTSAGVRMAGGFGRVVVADLGKRHLTVEHREINTIKMPAMRMMFAVRSRDLMERLRPGDRIHFTIDRSDMAITGLMVLQRPD